MPIFCVFNKTSTTYFEAPFWEVCEHAASFVFSRSHFSYLETDFPPIFPSSRYRRWGHWGYFMLQIGESFGRVTVKRSPSRNWVLWNRDTTLGTTSAAHCITACNASANKSQAEYGKRGQQVSPHLVLTLTPFYKSTKTKAKIERKRRYGKKAELRRLR